mmetsp:Transcript_6284/g.14449  ORF Transcript_6284/g.14449 Transcript_6284/m.14449 type:complete len:223 (-) Transcript_6284:347-1015(-)
MLSVTMVQVPLGLRARATLAKKASVSRCAPWPANSPVRSGGSGWFTNTSSTLPGATNLPSSRPASTGPTAARFARPWRCMRAAVAATRSCRSSTQTHRAAGSSRACAAAHSPCPDASSILTGAPRAVRAKGAPPRPAEASCRSCGGAGGKRASKSMQPESGSKQASRCAATRAAALGPAAAATSPRPKSCARRCAVRAAVEPAFPLSSAPTPRGKTRFRVSA